MDTCVGTIITEQKCLCFISLRGLGGGVVCTAIHRWEGGEEEEERRRREEEGEGFGFMAEAAGRCNICIDMYI